MTSKDNKVVNLKQFTQAILHKNNVSKYFIEYGGYLSNHMSHVLIALYRLSASEKYMIEYINNHTKLLEKSSRSTTQVNQEVNLRWRPYFEILGSFRHKLSNKYGGSITLLVAKEFPRLSYMTSGAALHGLIHLGYGISILDRSITCEGLAYLEYAGSPFLFDEQIATPIELFGKGNKELISILKEISKIYPFQFKKYLDEEVSKPWIINNNRGRFQNRMKVLLQNDGNTIMTYVNEMKIPSELLSEKTLQSLCDWLLDTTIILYLASDRTNDFFLLHGISSTWSLIQVLTNAFHGERKKSLEILRLHVGVLMATYITQHAPNINEENLEKETESLKNISWLEIKSKLLNDLPKDSDDHVYKLVQICYETARKSEHKSDMELLYKKAAITVMSNSFLFGSI